MTSFLQLTNSLIRPTRLPLEVTKQFMSQISPSMSSDVRRKRNSVWAEINAHHLRDFRMLRALQ